MQTFNIDEYNRYINDCKNGYKQSKIIRDIELTILNKPSVLIGNNDSSYYKYLYFVVSYTSDNKDILSYQINSFQTYSERLKILSFDMNKRICIISDTKDTIPAIDVFFERTYGLSPQSEILVIFDKQKVIDATKKTFKVYVDDIGVGMGTQIFEYRKKTIVKTPKLKIENSL